MFEAKLSSSLVLKRVVDAIKDMINDGIIYCTSAGIEMHTMDTAHVSLIFLQLERDGFESYRCDRDVTMGINFRNMATILKGASNDDSVVMTYNEAKSDEVTFKFERPDKTAKYTMFLLNLEGECMTIPDTQYNCSVTMPAREYAQVCRDLAATGENITIACKEDCISFGTTSDYGSARIKFKTNDEVGVVMEAGEALSLSFASQYLVHFAKAAPLSPSVTMQISADLPLSVEYTIPNIGLIRYYLAPRIDV